MLVGSAREYRRILVVAAGVLMVSLIPAIGVTQPSGRVERATLELQSNRPSYAVGSSARVVARMKIASGWHTNSHNPTFDYLIATEVEVESPTGWPSASIEYPRGEMKRFAFADEPISVYEGKVDILTSLEIPAAVQSETEQVEFRLTYQACDDRSCLPPVTTSKSITLQIGSEGRLSSDPVFSVDTSRSRPVSHTRNLGLFLVLGLLGGLILNAMPCVLPVLSLKVFGLVKSAGQGRAEVVVGALATAAGIILSFWALALTAVLGRSAGSAVGWGVQFQEPIFVTVLAIVVILFCLNLWGIFEIPLPRRLAQFADSGPKEGIPGHLASGLFATLMATPCSAPFLGTAVGFALSQTAATILAVFTAIGIGMAIPYLLLAAVPRVATVLPKPGPWMEKVKILMGFLLAATVVWLFYVLAAQMTRERVAFIELSLLSLALFVWLRHRGVQRRGAKLLAMVGVLASITCAVALAAGAREFTAARQMGSVEKLISWEVFDRSEAERLRDEGQLVFVDVTADWCFTCKVNERMVLETPTVADAFADHEVVAMKADWTNRSDTITQFLSDHGRYGIPFYLLYRPGRDPHLFGELLTQDSLIEVVQEASSN